MKKLDLKEIVLIGRTFEEYYRMFDLKNIRKDNEKILDVASGVSSFCSEAVSKGYNVTASDRIYCFTPDEIENKCASDLETVISKVPSILDMYKWEFFKNVDELKQNREKAYKLFIQDYRAEGNSRYVFTEYPNNSFSDNQFTLSLVSHFLFMYDEHLDYEFHKKVLHELIRITSGEIRIFPLVNLKGERSVFVDRLMTDSEFNGHKFEVRGVDYEFVRGGNEVMVVKEVE